jgi:hypothetical protein
MKVEEVLERSPLVLDQRSRERYFEDGFLVLPAYIGAAWLDRLRAVVAAKIEASRSLSTSDDHSNAHWGELRGFSRRQEFPDRRSMTREWLHCAYNMVYARCGPLTATSAALRGSRP